jgi:hypothetical protein
MQKKLEFYVCKLMVGYFKSKGSVFISGNAFILNVDKCENKIFQRTKKKKTMTIVLRENRECRFIVYWPTVV